MRPVVPRIPEEQRLSRRRINWELYYYERVGNRLYFRITPFAIILMVVAAICGITILIIDTRKNPPREANVNISVPTPSSNDNYPTIRPAPPAFSPSRVVKRPRVDVPTKQIPPAPTLSPGGLSTSSPTPSPTSARTPT